MKRNHDMLYGSDDAKRTYLLRQQICKRPPWARCSFSNVLMEMRTVAGEVGFDFGFSRAKIALATPSWHRLPIIFGEGGRTHKELTLHLVQGDELAGESAGKPRWALQFVTVETQMLDKITADDSDAEDMATLDTWTVCAAGGGAHKFKAMFFELFKIALDPIPEIESTIKGLLALHVLRPPGELVTYEGTQERETSWPDPLFPLLLVNIGSGISVLRVDGADPEIKFKRVGGTACGGATFLGLAKLMTSARTFEDALDLANAGSTDALDKSVADIYGESEASSLGLPGTLTASNFGRLANMDLDSSSFWPPCEEDVARSLLEMVISVVHSSAVLAKAHAVQLEVPDGMRRVFFSGGFVCGKNRLARQTLAKSLATLGGQANFFTHSDFLGALGSLSCCMGNTSTSVLNGNWTARCSATQILEL